MERSTFNNTSAPSASLDQQLCIKHLKYTLLPSTTEIKNANDRHAMTERGLTVIRYNKRKGGRKQYATTAIPAHAIICQVDEPFVAIPNNRSLHSVCYECLKGPAEKLTSCTTCQGVKYCSEACQQRNKWLHKLECPMIGKFKAAGNTLPTFTLAVVHLLLIYTHDLMNAGAKVRWDAVIDLVSHMDSMRRLSSWSDTQIQAAIALKACQLDQQNLDLATKLLCIVSHISSLEEPDRNSNLASFQVDVNAFELTNSNDDRPLGLCLEPCLALFNHSCEPNAIIKSEGRIVSLRALKSIKKDQEICIQYIDLNADVHARRAQLSSRYWFSCSCARCIRELKESAIQGQQLALVERFIQERVAPLYDQYRARYPKGPAIKPYQQDPYLKLQLMQMCRSEAQLMVLGPIFPTLETMSARMAMQPKYRDVLEAIRQDLKLDPALP